jgi:hypothetical protein
MKTQTSKILLAFLVCNAASLLSLRAFDDNFTNATVTGSGGSGVVSGTGGGNVYQFPYDTGTSFAVTTDPSGINDGNALEISPSTSNATPYLKLNSPFSSAVNLGAGQTLTFSFDLRFTSTPTSGDGLTFGVYNSSNGDPEAYSGDPSNDTNNGYTLYVDPTGGGEGIYYQNVDGQNYYAGGPDGLGTNIVSGSSPSTGTSAYFVDFTVGLNAAGTSESYSLTLTPLAGGTPFAISGTSTSNLVTNFNYLGFGESDNDQFLIDNVTVATPEPSVTGLLLASVGFLALWARSRRFSSVG